MRWLRQNQTNVRHGNQLAPIEVIWLSIPSTHSVRGQCGRKTIPSLPLRSGPIANQQKHATSVDQNHLFIGSIPTGLRLEFSALFFSTALPHALSSSPQYWSIFHAYQIPPYRRKIYPQNLYLASNLFIRERYKIRRHLHYQCINK